MDQIPKFKVGQKVKVVKPGGCYPTYSDFFTDNNVPIDIAIRFQYCRSLADEDYNDQTYIVDFVGEHHCKGEGALYVIHDMRSCRTYLVNEYALKAEPKVWKVPVTWQMCGVLEIEADSLEKACDIAYDSGLPDDGEYIDASFEVDDEDLEYVRRYYNDGQEDNPDEDV
jgi:hypothetical protein